MERNFSFAQTNMIPYLKEIWRECFPSDSKDDRDFFFARIFRTDNCLVCLENGRPASMVFLLPALLQHPQGTRKVQYIYAAATRPIYRGQGIFRSLLEKAHEVGRRNGNDFSFLRPAEPGLRAYYESFGYHPFFYCESGLQTREEFLQQEPCVHNGCESVFTFLTSENSENSEENQEKMDTDFSALREDCLKQYPLWIRWENQLLNFAVESATKTGGGVVTGSGCWAICELVGQTLWMKEWICSPEKEPSMRRFLAEKFPVKQFGWRKLPYSSFREEAFGWILPLTEQARLLEREAFDYKGFMGLAFD